MLLPGSGTADETRPTEVERIALSLANELACLTSGIEGSAHGLIDAAPDRARLPRAAEALLAAVQRLRTLHTKMVALGQGNDPADGVTAIDAVIKALAVELPHLQLGLQVRWETRRALPEVRASFDVVRDALLFLCSALLRAERGASILAIDAEHTFAHDEPAVQLLLSLEHAGDVPNDAATRTPDRSWQFDYEAAANLIRAQGGRVEVSHRPGQAVQAIVRLPVAATAAAALATPPVPIPTPPAASAAVAHDYGGALVLEADAATRAMLAAELKAGGRAVFVCADGAAAESFLRATPQRFELLIADDARHLATGSSLATAIRELTPHLKLCVLGRPGAGPAEFGVAQYLPKPFGVHELRQALASLLASC